MTTLISAACGAWEDQPRHVHKDRIIPRLALYSHSQFLYQATASRAILNRQTSLADLGRPTESTRARRAAAGLTFDQPRFAYRSMLASLASSDSTSDRTLSSWGPAKRLGDTGARRIAEAFRPPAVSFSLPPPASGVKSSAPHPLDLQTTRTIYAAHVGPPPSARLRGCRSASRESVNPKPFPI